MDVLKESALPFGVQFWAPDFGKLPCSCIVEAWTSQAVTDHNLGLCA